MKKVLVIWVCVVALSATGWAQKPVFRSQNYIGFLEGNRGSAFQFQTVNGMQWRTWFAGVGTGLDWYLYRSLPLYLSVQKDLKAGNRTFFLSLDGGTNFSWEKRKPEFAEFVNSKFFPRLYGGMNVGYKTILKNNKDAILFTIGYSYKELRERQSKYTYCINPPCPLVNEYYNYKNNRVSLRLGWQF